MPYDDDDLRDAIFRQANENSNTKKELKNAVKHANFDTIAEFIWKVAAKLLGQRVPVLKENAWLRWLVTELVPMVYHLLKDNWNSLFGR